MFEKENQNLYRKKALLLASCFLYSAVFQTSIVVPFSASGVPLTGGTLAGHHTLAGNNPHNMANTFSNIQNQEATTTIHSKGQPPILIQAVETSTTEFSAYTTAEMIKTYAKYQLEVNRKTPRPVKLNALLKKAQMEFLSPEPSRSQKTFQIIADNIHSFDWNTEERKIIFYALFRLAQLEKNAQKQELFLKEALTFEMGLKLETQIFPPPLIRLYSKLKKTASFTRLKLSQLFPLHEILMINGKVYSNREKVALPYGMYRVTAFSSSHKSWRQTLSLSRLISRKVKTRPLIKGSCQQTNLKELNPALRKRVRVLFPNFCVWSFPLVESVKLSENLLPAEIKMVEKELEKPAQSKEWWEEEWLWLGTGLAVALGAVFIFSESKDKKTKPEKKPTVKIGF